MHRFALISTASLLVLAALLGSRPATACSFAPGHSAPPRTVSAAERLAKAALVVAGEVMSRVDDRDTNTSRISFRVAEHLKGASPDVVQMHGALYAVCMGPVRLFNPGEWWVLYAARDDRRGGYVITGREAYCARGDTVADADNGTCRRVLASAMKAGRLNLAAGSRVVLGPDRDVLKPVSAELAAGSTFQGAALPARSVVVPSGDYVSLPKPLTLGPIQLSGHVRFGNLHDYSNPSKLYFAEPDDMHALPGKVRVYGAEVSKVYFPTFGPGPLRVELARPQHMQGYYMTDYAEVDARGKVESFRAAGKQVVDGVKINKCDNVQLEDGKAAPYVPFYNPCVARGK